MMEIKMFAVEGKELTGRTHNYDFLFDIDNDIKVLEELKEKVTEPQILCYTGLDCIDFYAKTYDEHFIGHDSIRWLYEIKCKETDTVNDMRGCMLKCSTEDTEWTQKRNEGLTGIFYRKITFLPEVQELLINKYDEYLKELLSMKEEMENRQQKEKKERESRQKAWKIVKEYKHINPYGVESGRDGYIDADYQNENGVIVRMVSRDVFDFGCYSYPKRVEGTEDAFSNDIMTEEEKSLCKWLFEFGEFSGIRM